MTCGITFTFGGLRINRDAQVLSRRTSHRWAVRLWGAGRRDFLLQLPWRLRVDQRLGIRADRWRKRRSPGCGPPRSVNGEYEQTWRCVVVLPPFDLLRPSTLETALQMVADGGTPYCGGTELLAVMRLGLARPDVLVDLKRVPELAAGISEAAPTGVRLGARVTPGGCRLTPAASICSGASRRHEPTGQCSRPCSRDTGRQRLLRGTTLRRPHRVAGTRRNRRAA